MSRSKKWRLKWSFFLVENGRRQYNRLCKGYVQPCKQSFQAVAVACLSFLPFPKVRELGPKMGEETACGGFSV